MINDALLPDEVRTYIQDHKIDVVVTDVLNGVVKDMPPDPLERIVCEIARHSVSLPYFVELRRDHAAERKDLRFHIYVSVRGQRVKIHSFALGETIFAVPEVLQDGEAAQPPAEGTAEQDPKEARAKRIHRLEEEGQLQKFLEDFFAKSFGKVCIDDFLTFYSRCEGLSGAPCPGDLTIDTARATARLCEELLVAACLATDTTRLTYLQQQLAKAGAQPSPPLRSRRHFAVWRPRWPRLAMPVFFGGGPSVLRPPSLRCSAAITPFALGSAAAATGDVIPEAVDCPPLSWVTSAVGVLRGARAEALKILQGDKATAALAADGVPYGHPGGLGKTLELTAEALKRAGGDAAAAEGSGVLFAAAEEAWVEEEGVYEVETGKKLALEQLVDFYAEIAESGWLRMIVQPFREVDMSAGCALLREKSPELRLIAQPAQDAAEAARSAPGGAAAYGQALRLEGSLPEVLQRYAETEPLWREAGGCAVCALLDAPAAKSTPAMLDLVIALPGTEVVCISPEAEDEDLARISASIDQTAIGALYADDTADGSADDGDKTAKLV